MGRQTLSIVGGAEGLGSDQDHMAMALTTASPVLVVESDESSVSTSAHSDPCVPNPVLLFLGALVSG